jgi:CBS domain-containing protein
MTEMICPHCGFDNLPGAEECAQCLQDLTQFDRPAAHTRIERSLMEDHVSVLKPAKPVTIRPTTTLAEAIQTMIQHNVGALLVVGDGGNLLGIFSERDVLMQVVGLRENYGDLPVSLFMTPNPETVKPTDSLAFALHKMDGGDYRHLPVIKAGKPVGIFSVRDLLRYVSHLCRE